MKTRYLVRSILATVLMFIMAHSAQAITAMGNHPFYQPPLTSTGDLYTMVAEKKWEIKVGFKAAGIGPVYDSFMDQIGKAEIREVTYEKGTTLQWMFFRRNGEGPLLVDNHVVWESDTPISAYEFDIDHDGQRYTFSVPFVCGNIALKGIGPIVAPVAPVAPPAEEVVEQTPPPVAPAVAPKLMPFVVDLGLSYQVDPATYLIARIGYEHYLTDNISVLGMVGVAPKLDGPDGESAFIIDVFANYNWSKWYAGIGLGGWITDGDDDLDAEDSDLDLILNVGSEIYEKPDAYTLSLYVEARSGIDEISDFDLYGQLGAGLRVHF
jgi:hypothetical protein